VWFYIAAKALRGDQRAIAEANRIRSSMTEKDWKDTQKKLPRGTDPKKVDDFLRGAN
jgi:hypothetical protein